MKMYLLALVIIILFLSCTPKIKKELPPVSTAVPKISGTYLWAYKPTANIRESNSAKSRKIVAIADGDSVLVIKNVEGWYEIFFNQNRGWIRSDLVGTKNLSVYRKAVSFSDSLADNFDIRLYFDKKIQHKRIFLEFPQSEYSSKNNIENKTKELGKKYQETVYSGKVTIQVIEPKKQSEYLTINLAGAPNAVLKLPVIRFGILDEIIVINKNELKLIVSINEHIENALLLKEARKIAGSFPLTLKKVNITFKNKSQKCILSFVEDASGEHYKFNFCL